MSDTHHVSVTCPSCGKVVRLTLGPDLYCHDCARDMTDLTRVIDLDPVDLEVSTTQRLAIEIANDPFAY